MWQHNDLIHYTFVLLEGKLGSKAYAQVLIYLRVIIVRVFTSIYKAPCYTSWLTEFAAWGTAVGDGILITTNL